ncbi:acetyl-CoA carboxylase biotin carboxyl carrier protein [Reichenbachiella agarivorans]|uniref:Biotin carboxyl carrier protein of acetyl-CoA carboxylase n=1 Tax=Reichenbachiella agarivorans TaxID=2979464 RepID=A0ABY6CQP1_9BACT|nr:acetyl-CoA carboxylase biotin carboxyl carrier protein [Reichenbachiella agarivorans]UXP30615.1 acetyl-CoA carboxylase biotin carboxyl carrier protein [Reichenbachiella agarivorans]
MKVKEIRDLIDFLSSTGLEEVNIETEEFKIKVKRSSETQVVEKMVASAPSPVAVAPAPVAAPVAAAPAATAAAPKSEGNYLTIKSPMIGTFYRSANPESPEFVSIGDKVSAGDPVCIIEAMKLFNEIESEVSGTIVKVLVENAQPVEYDQPLFLVDPS